jgi:hypothetical protein
MFSVTTINAKYLRLTHLRRNKQTIEAIGIYPLNEFLETETLSNGAIAARAAMNVLAWLGDLNRLKHADTFVMSAVAKTPLLEVTIFRRKKINTMTLPTKSYVSGVPGRRDLVAVIVPIEDTRK